MTSKSTVDEMSLLEEAGFWCFRVADGDMSDEEQSAFQAWLNQSVEHHRAFDDSIRVWRRIGEVSLQPEWLAARSVALEHLRATNRTRWAPRPFSIAPLLAIAASVVVLTFGCLVYYSEVAFTTYSTRTSERRVVLLDDESRISLDADTSVRVRYGRERRELHLERGRAKFDVANDTLRPFTVAAANRIVVATGTEFSVELLARHVHVILYEGRVNVVKTREAGGAERRKDNANAVEARLEPGNGFIAGIASPDAYVEPNNLTGTLSWEAGFLTFADEPLRSAVERVNRYTDRKLAVGDAAAGELLVNGVYPTGNVEAFLEGITGVLPVRIEVHAGVRTFVQRGDGASAPDLL
jgi:transmembrane sensor